MRVIHIVLLISFLLGCHGHSSANENTNQDFQQTDIEFPATMVSGAIPVIYINTENNAPILDKVTLVNATCHIDCSMTDDFDDFGSIENPLELTIRGRGNSSWLVDKKPYKLKFSKKQSLFGLPKSKHYALIAESKTIGMMSFWAFELARKLGMAWAPHLQAVELVLNNSYCGLYFMIETIRIEEGRVNIFEQDDENSDSETIPGGWLVEIDNYIDDYQTTFNETPDKTVRITHHTPEILSEQQQTWFNDEFNDIFNRLENDDILSPTWPEKIDITSLARYFIVSEFLGNMDAYTGSFWWHKDLGENTKWVAGPVWDVGYVLDNREWVFNMRENPKHVHIIPNAIRYPVFLDEVKKEFAKLTPEFITQHYRDTEAFVKSYSDSFEADYVRWPGSLYYKTLDWFKVHIIPNKYALFTEDFENLYPDPSRIEHITSTAEGNQPTEVFDLSGRRLNPASTLPAGIYIFHTGNRVEKRVIR